jgi:hypothetical protein
LTGVTNTQSVCTGEITEAKAIVYVNGKMPSEATIALAQERNLSLMSTRHLMYEACGILHGRQMLGVGHA